MPRYNKPRKINASEFFEQNSSEHSLERVSEETYIIVHTAYLKNIDNHKLEVFKKWREKFSFPLSDESYEYLRENNAVLMRPNLIVALKSGEAITSTKFLTRMLTALEYDLWLVNELRTGGNYKSEVFEKYLTQKYGDFLTKAFKALLIDGLAYSKDLGYIAQALEPNYNQIKSILEGLIKANKDSIPFADETIDTLTPKNTSQEFEKTKENPLPVEYEIIFAERAERISKLENDVKEFKRQRDNLREYSVKQYDKGIMDLFALMNDKRYGKIIDYFYSLTKSSSADEVLISYLENLFMLFEDMDIEPIVSDMQNIDVDESRLTKDYDLDFDKQNYVKGQESVKYVGWRYKNFIIEKPTLRIKEE